MNTQPKLHSFHYLGSMCNDNSRLHTRIANTLFRQRYSHIFEITLLIIEYLQLVSQALILAPAVAEDPYFDKNPIFTAVAFLLKLFDLGFWLYSEEREIMTLVLLILSAVLTICKYVLYLYILLLASNRVKEFPILLGTWKFLFKIQSRVLCCFTTTLWVRAILGAVQNGVGLLGMDKNIIILIAALMIAMEYVLSFFLQNCYCYVLPAKGFLASRDNYLEVITLTQKVVTQLLQLVIPVNFAQTSWIFTSINILFSLSRECSYFATLPLYKFSALLCQGKLLMIVLSLNIACFFENILYSMDYKNSKSFILMTWFVLALLTVRIMIGHLNMIQLNLIDPDNKDIENLVIHKIKAIMSIEKLNRKSENYASKCPFSLLTKTAASTKIESLLHLTSEFKANHQLDITSKESLRRAIAHHLENLCIKYPKNKFLKLYIAYFYTNKFPMYGIAVKATNDLQRSGSLKMSLNASLLRYDMEVQIEREYKSMQNPLDMYKYLRSRTEVAQLEEKILAQIDTQSKLYHEVLSDKPDLAKLLVYAHMVTEKRREIEAKIKIVFSIIPDHYIKPLTMCSLYHLLLNFSLDNYLSYRKKFIQISQKYDRFYKGDTLCEENMFQESNLLMVVVAQKPECGKITFMPRSVLKAFGKEPQFFIGKSASKTAPPTVQEVYKMFYEYMEIRGPQSLPNVISRDFGMHYDGYLFPVDFCFTLHPYTTQGLYLNCIIRPSPVKKEGMLILENGNIEGATYKLAKRFGLFRRENLADMVNVRDISPDLKQINDAFNLVNAINKSKQQETQDQGSKWSKEIHSNQTKQDVITAEEIYSECLNNGKSIKIYLPSQVEASGDRRDHRQKTAYSYHCTMSNRFFGSVYIKELTLEEIGGEDGEDMNALAEDLTEKLLATVEKEIENSSPNKKQKDDVDDDFFDFEDEKQSGWIDFRSLEGKEFRKTSSPTLHPYTTEDPLSSPLSLEGLLTTQRAPLISEQRSNSVQKAINLTSNSAQFKRVKEEAKRKREVKMNIVYQANSKTSVTSKRAQQIKISRAFKLALESKQVTTLFKIVTFGFYALYLGVFVNQLTLKHTLDQAVNNLTIGKDVITYAEERSFYLSSIQINTRYLWDLAMGKMTAADLGRYSFLAPIMSSVRSENAVSLSNVNEDFFALTDSLYGSIKQSLFAKDINLIDEDGFTTLNSFQAVERIVEASLRTVNLMQIDVAEAKSDMMFLLNNTCNDIAIKNEAISDSLVDYFTNEENNIYTDINVSIIVTSILSVGLSFMITLMACYKHRIETHNMSAVIRINSNGIRDALDKIISFKRTIENETISDNRQNTEFIEQDRKINSNVINVARGHLKTLNNRGVLRIYLFYIGRVWLFILLIAGIAIGNCIAGKSSLESFGKKGYQLYFMARLKSTISTVGAVYHELLAENGATLNHNMLTPIYMGQAIATLNTMKNELATIFLNDDATYNSEVAEILFSNGCPSIETGDWFSLCNEMRLSENIGNLNYLLIDYENLMTEQLKDFQASNGTSSSLYAIVFTDLENITSNYLLTTSMCDAVTNITDSAFEIEIKSANKQRQSIFIVLVFALVILSYLAWVYILQRILVHDQRFKKVLSVFPPDLVLSNFILKSFLMKNSKGVLNSIKNDI